MSYRLDTRFGKFNVNSATVSSATYRTSNDSSIVPIVTNGSAFRVRSNLVLGYEGNFGASWTARYYSGVKETCSNIALYPDECSDPGVYAPWYKGARNYNERGAVTFHDVQVRYSLPWDATVSVGANNVFEKTGRSCSKRTRPSRTTVVTISAASSTCTSSASDPSRCDGADDHGPSGPWF